MNPLFKNITTYDSKNYNQFLEFHKKNFSFSYNFFNIILLIMLLYFIIMNIIEKAFPFVLLFVGLIIFLFLIRIYIPMKRHEKTEAKYNNNQEDTFTFSFYKYYFTVSDKTFYYFKLYKTFETEDYFYLYLDDENAVLISKSGFEIGSSEEFSKFIKKKCFFKYHKNRSGPSKK